MLPLAWASSSWKGTEWSIQTLSHRALSWTSLTSSLVVRRQSSPGMTSLGSAAERGSLCTPNWSMASTDFCALKWRLCRAKLRLSNQLPNPLNRQCCSFTTPSSNMLQAPLNSLSIQLQTAVRSPSAKSPNCTRGGARRSERKVVETHRPYCRGQDWSLRKPEQSGPSIANTMPEPPRPTASTPSTSVGRQLRRSCERSKLGHAPQSGKRSEHAEWRGFFHLHSLPSHERPERLLQAGQPPTPFESY